MRILFLDDDPQRWQYFHQLVAAKLPDSNAFWVQTVGEFKMELDRSMNWDQIYLDHDLADFHYTNQEATEDTGEDAARYLAAKLKGALVLPSVVVHSYNNAGAMRMLKILEDVEPAWAEYRPFGPHMLIT